MPKLTANETLIYPCRRLVANFMALPMAALRRMLCTYTHTHAQTTFGPDSKSMWTRAQNYHSHISKAIAIFTYTHTMCVAIKKNEVGNKLNSPKLLASDFEFVWRNFATFFFRFGFSFPFSYAKTPSYPAVHSIFCAFSHTNVRKYQTSSANRIQLKEERKKNFGPCVRTNHLDVAQILLPVTVFTRHHPNRAPKFPNQRKHTYIVEPN